MDAMQNIHDPSREETEAAADVISEAMNQPLDGYWMSVAEDALRAASRVRLRVTLNRCPKCGGPLEGWAGEHHSQRCPLVDDTGEVEADARFERALGEGRR